MLTSELATTNGIGTPEDLAKLTMGQLVSMWNGLPGVVAVKKFTNRNIAMARIWKQAMGETLPGIAVAKKDAAPKTKKAKAAKKPKAKAAKKAKAPRAKKEGDGKKAEVLRLLQRANGVTLEEIVEKTGWQKHTVRGFISILGNKEKGGQKIESFKTEKGVRTYRIN